MTDTPREPHHELKPPGLCDRVARRVLVNNLAELNSGEIVLNDASGVQKLGQSCDLTATLQVHRPQFFRQAVLGGSLSVAASYLDGDWDCDDLTSLFRIFVRNRETADRFDAVWTKLKQFTQRIVHWWRTNTIRGSRNNIEAHYDLGNDFFQLWLDDTMAYSSAIFPRPNATLAEGSREKFNRVCRLLELQASDHLLEIGTGWGGLAIHAAENYGCRVTSTTISARQFEHARTRIAARGLANRVTLLQQDYRDLAGKYDKLASIEMIEAVGHRFLDRYFRQCSELLRPDGSLALQAIVMPERNYQRYLRSVDFIQRYVFPGGCLPSLGTMLDSVGRATDLRFVQAEDFAGHYAETLRRWSRAFHNHLAEVRALGFPERFIRMWRYYLCYCEAAFEEQAIGVLQIRFDKPACRRRVFGTSSKAAVHPKREDQRPFATMSAVVVPCEVGE